MSFVNKQMESTVQKIGNNTFYIYPFPAFTSANLSGEIAGLLTPLVTQVAAAVGMSKEKSVMDMDVSKIAPQITGAFSSLSGDKVERLLRKLLLEENVGIMPEGESHAVWLNEEICNVVFSGSTQDMFILAFYVIKVNYADFFGKFGSLYGNAKEILQEKMKTAFPGMEPLT